MKVLLFVILLVAFVASQGFLTKLKEVDVEKEKIEVEKNVAVHTNHKKSQVITNVLKNNVTNIEVNLNAVQDSLVEPKNLLGAVDVTIDEDEVDKNVFVHTRHKNSDVITNVLKNNETNVSVNINAEQLAQIADIVQLLNLNPSNQRRKLREVDVEKEIKETDKNIVVDVKKKAAQVITNVLKNNITSVDVIINASQAGELQELVDLIKQNPQLLENLQKQLQGNNRLREVDVSKEGKKTEKNVDVDVRKKASQIITNVLKNNITSVDVNINISNLPQLFELEQRDN